MFFRLTNISGIIFLAALVNVLVTYAGWQRRNTKAGMYFAWGMLAITLWTLSAGLDYAAVPIPLKVFFAKLEYTTYSSALFLLLACTLEYTGYGSWLESKLFRSLLILLPASITLLAWTNDLHSWLWTGFTPSPVGDNVVVFEHGPGFTWVALSTYPLVILMLFILLQASFKGTAPARRQGRMILLAFLIPVLSNLLYLSDLFHKPGVDWSSVSFSITGVLLLVALHGEQFLGIVPIARNTVLDRLADAVLVLDPQGNLVDFNPAAQQVFEIQQADLWHPIDAVLNGWPEIIRHISGEVEETHLEVAKGEPGRFFDIHLTPLLDAGGKVNGQIVVARDVTLTRQAEIDLRASEEQFRNLMMAAPDAVFGVDEDNKIRFANSEALQLFGYTMEEIIGADAARLAPAHMRSKQIEHRELVFGNLDALVNDQGLWAVHKDGHEIPIDIRLSRISTEGGPLMVAFLSDLTQRVEKDLQIRQAQGQLLDQQRQLAVIEERQRMARELHDSVNQSIHSVVLFSETLAAALEKGDHGRARKIIERLQESARQSLKETRLLLYELQAVELQTGENLVQNLENRLAMVEQRAGVRVDFLKEGSLIACPPEWYEHLYWIATEALNNTLKHAQARTVWVRLSCSSERLILEVRDNGIGFVAGEVGVGGMGLGNLRDRAGLIGGELTIESEPGKGTTVRLVAEIKA